MIDREPEPDTDWDAYSDDPRQAALAKVQQRGLMTGAQLAQFNELYDELERAGRLGWIDKACAIAEAKKASTAGYALRVLANAIHTGHEPGYTNGHTSKPAPSTPSKLDRKLEMRKQRMYDILSEEVIQRINSGQDSIPDWERKLDALYETPVDTWDAGLQAIIAGADNEA